MADLIDHPEPGDPRPCSLRISIRWAEMRVQYHDFGDYHGDFMVGAFLDDAPLFTGVIYEHPRGWGADWLLPGYFTGVATGFAVFDALAKCLTEHITVELEEFNDPTFLLKITPFISAEEKEAGLPPSFYDVLLVIQHGGPWHGAAMGASGPAVFMTAVHEQLLQFFEDLLREAVAPEICTPDARDLILQHIGSNYPELVPGDLRGP